MYVLHENTKRRAHMWAEKKTNQKREEGQIGETRRAGGNVPLPTIPHYTLNRVDMYRTGRILYF